MTKFLINRFIGTADPSSPDVRARYGNLAGMVGIVMNAILCALKMLIGTLSGSVSITADAVNNLSDASSCVMTLIGFKLSQKPADKEHPYGHARFEYLSGLLVAMLIILIGCVLAKSSFLKILHPEEIDFSLWIVVVLLLSIAGKLYLAHFNKTVGNIISSKSLLATAADSRNDVISTSAVLFCAIVGKLTGLCLDGYIGLAVAVFILLSGAGIAKETISPLLGESADEELTSMIESEVLSFDPHILGLHDLMVHDYGPGRRIATLHAEIDARESVTDMHEILDNLEIYMREKHHILLTVHYDPIVTDDEELNAAKERILAAAKAIDPAILTHDFRMVRGKNRTNIIFDMVLSPARMEQKDAIKHQMDETVKALNPNYRVVITFDLAAFNHT